MSEERRTAPVSKPPETAAPAPSFPPPAEKPVGARRSEPSPPRSRPPKDSSDGSGTRRRHALRIPDDEISRPDLRDAAGNDKTPSEPKMPAEPLAVTLMPMRIITISDPSPAPIGALPAAVAPLPLASPASAAGSKPTPVAKSKAAKSNPALDQVTPRVPPAFGEDEVEVRFDDDAPALSRAEITAPSVAPAVAFPVTTGKEKKASTPPAPAIVPVAPVALAPEVSAAPATPSSVLPAATPPAVARESLEDQLTADGDRRSSPGDPPEIAAEDLVTLEPPPVRSVAAPPPARPKSSASPPSTAPPVPPLTSKPPPIPTPRPPLVIVPPRVGSMAAQPPDASAAKRKGRLWWEELFNDDYLRATEKVTDEQMDREVAFIEESLSVERGGTLLDLACGTGRHAVELARRGYEVVGFDLSLAMLARAGEDAQDHGAKLNFVQGDMREMSFDEQFDGVYCWNTSFGYFEEDKNAQVVARIRQALKEGGTFLLDVVNRDFLIRQSPSLAWFEGDGCVCMDEMSVDFITSRMKVKRTMMLDDGRSREIEYSMRVYSLHELGKILHENGFKVREVSGRLTTPGVFFGDESPRTIILAEKK